MSLQHAMLGILSQQPMTGYDLKTVCFDQTIAHFWQADQAQIYRTLDKMADAGYVESTLEIQTERPNRKVYSITDAGRAELRRWLLSPQAMVAYREPLLVQLFFAESLTNAQIIMLLEAQQRAHAARQQDYAVVPLPPLDALDKDNRTAQLQRLTLELGLRIEAAYQEWFTLALSVVRGMGEK